MTKPQAVDIIVPVWNRPVETRNCLVNIINYSADARLIMVDNGSDRETEKMLQEISEGLDDRALLLRNDKNQGLVKALNKGLEKGEGDFFVVIRSTSLVSAGWLNSLLDFCRQHPEAGLVVPGLVKRVKGEEKKGLGAVTEISHGSFDAMAIKKDVYTAIGGFDEGMDGGLWCLKDYTRRAWQAGFITVRVPQVIVQFMEEVQLGSEVRRQENLQKIMAEFRQRWGAEASYCLIMPKGADPSLVRSRLELLLRGARHGFIFHLIVHHQLHRELVKTGHTSLHENIIFHPLPVFNTSGTIKKSISRIAAQIPDTTIVAGIDGMSPAGIENPLPFATLEERIRRCNDRRD